MWRCYIMGQWFKKFLPNVYTYRDKFFINCWATLRMFFISGIFSFFLGIVLGVILTITKKGGIKQNRVIFHILDIIINIFRVDFFNSIHKKYCWYGYRGNRSDYSFDFRNGSFFCQTGRNGFSECGFR